MISEYKLSKFKCRICKYCDAPLDAQMGGDDPVCPCFEEVPDVD